MVLVLYIFYVGYISWYLFVLVLLLPILSLLFLLLGMIQFHIQLQCASRYTIHSDAYITIQNKTSGWLPLASVTVALTYHNHFTNETENVIASFASEHTLTEVKLDLPTDDLGCIDIEIKSITFHDYLGLFRFKKRVQVSDTTYIYPKTMAWSEEVSILEPAIEDGDEVIQRGYEQGDSFDVHEYREGDSLHRVHWKLSAKLDQIMVKEFTSTIRKTRAVYFEYYGSKQDCEMILTNVYNFSQYLLQEQVPFKIVQFMNGQSSKEQSVNTHADLDACMRSLLTRYCTSASAPSMSEHIAKGQAFFIRKDGLHQGGEAHGYE